MLVKYKPKQKLKQRPSSSKNNKDIKNVIKNRNKNMPCSSKNYKT